MKPRTRVNWQVCLLRGWTLKDAGNGVQSMIDPGGHIVVTSNQEAVLEAMIIDWHAAANWPTLFAELPKGTMLVRPPDDDAPGFTCCGCNITSAIPFCSADDEAGKAVVGAWMSFKLGQQLGPDLVRALQELVKDLSSSQTVH